MRILLLSAYDALSHRYWREHLVAQFPVLDWTVLALPPRHFSFRVRSNPISWWLAERDALEQTYDLIIATSLVDMATLRGLFPSLGAAPLWLYCHENQFVYPDSIRQQRSAQGAGQLEAQMVFLYNCLCADAISFNSQWNRTSALHGLAQLLARMPEKWGAALPDAISAKCDVLPVPLQPNSPAVGATLKPRAAQADHWQIIWNHRWEHDKGPEHLLAFAKALHASAQHESLSYTLHVVGQQFRQQPESFAQLKALLDARSLFTQDTNSSEKNRGINTEGGLNQGAWGFIESRDDYQALLSRADIVVSTATHDFQGIAILEAVQAGCLPLLPDQLVYPEQFDAEYLYCWAADPSASARAMVERLRHWRSAGRPLLPPVAQFGWPALHDAYRQKIQSLAAG